jgi:hypothetical protein
MYLRPEAGKRSGEAFSRLPPFAWDRYRSVRVNPRLMLACKLSVEANVIFECFK